MNIQKRHLTYFLIAIIDMALILASYFLASFIYLGKPLAAGQLVGIRVLSLNDSGLTFLIVYSFLVVVGYAAAKVFGCIYHGHIRKMVKSVICINAIGIVFFTFSFYVFNLDDASRVLIFLFFAFSTLFVCFANWAAIHFFRFLRNSQKYKKNVLVVGRGHLAKEYSRAVGTRSSRFEHVIGYVASSPYQAYQDYLEQNNGGMSMGQGQITGSGSNSASESSRFSNNELGDDRDYLGPCLGSVYDLEWVFANYQVDEIVLALDVEDYSCVRMAVAAADKHGVALTLVPFYNDIIPREPNIDSFGGVNVVDLRSMPLSNPLYAGIKRLSDIIVSIIVIVLTSWLMLITAIGVKVTSPGPVFFKQVRIGRGNKTFEMLKFRSMRINDSSDVAWSTNEDPRKTRFGSFIRKYSIDELPQFFNVLKGDMSIVGPRPEIPFFVNQFSENIPLYMLRHQVRPGITGLSQISGYRGDTSIEKRIETDLFYIQHWSFWLDVKIFFQTLFGGFVNDEVIADASIDSKMSGSKIFKVFNSINESAMEGSLGKIFSCFYLLMIFVYVFFRIYINPSVPVIPGELFSFGTVYHNNIAYVLIGFGVLVGIAEKRKVLFWIIAIISLYFFNLIAVRSGIIQLLALFAFVFAYPKSLKLDTAAGAVFLGSIAAILAIVFSCMAGVIPDHIGNRGDIVRHSMGFISPNAFATTVTAALIPYVYFRLHNWKWFDVVLCLAVGGITYWLADGRMSALMLLFLIAFACTCRFEKMQKLLLKIAPWIVVFCFCLTVFVYYLYWQGPETEFSSFLNNLSSGRFYYVSSFFDDYQIKIFGQNIATVSAADVIHNPGKVWRGIDCSYVNILLRFGVVGTILLILPTIWLGFKARQGRYTAATFVIAVIALFSITENFYYNVNQDFGIIIMGFFIATWATKRVVPRERASSPIDKSIDWVNMKGSRWKDFLDE